MRAKPALEYQNVIGVAGLARSAAAYVKVNETHDDIRLMNRYQPKGDPMKTQIPLPPEQADAAAERYDQLAEAMQHAGIPFEPDVGTEGRIRMAFAFSAFIAKIWTRRPETLAELLASGDLNRSVDSAYFTDRVRRRLDSLAANDEEGLIRELRLARNREMTRIAFRDLCRMADLDETLRDLSALADAAISGALDPLYREHRDRFGTPCDADGEALEIVVLGMGKLGARELNFSSDIDLIFAFPEAGETREGPRTITNDDFFTRLCRRLIHVLSVNTAEGFAFRVDMNLRPFGESGPLVMSFDAMEAYYQEQGREWERYAWIKARPVAGDIAAGNGLLRRLNPFIFRRYLDYGVFESLRDMKRRIEAEVRRKGMADDIKLGRGGIREVEFFGQIFQLLRGGVVPALQTRGIQPVLDILVREGLIDKAETTALREAYRFLRMTENRLQAFGDRQTHKLPSTPPERARLAASMGFSDWLSFFERLSCHMGVVHGHFANLLGSEGEAPASDLEKRLEALWRLPLPDDEEQRALLRAAGFDEPDAALTVLRETRDDLEEDTIASQGRERIDRLMPAVIVKTGRSETPEVALDRMISLVHTIRKRTNYVSLLLEHPSALDQLVRLAAASGWILAFLSRHPMLLDELLDPRTLYRPPEREELAESLARRFAKVDPDDLETQMDELRIFKQINVLRVAAADISDAIPLMRVSDHLSDIAETVLHKVLDIAWNNLFKRHGAPDCRPPLTEGERGFVMIAYGKLGGLELGYDSDLDLVFLHSGTGENTHGDSPTDTTTFFARLGQRMLNILSPRTTAGKLYEPDMRLRPSGSSGILVCGIDGFRDYQMEDAWTWEKQALIRARAIVGDDRLKARFAAIRAEVLAQPRDAETLKQEIREMRGRMRAELLRREPGMFDLKQDDGGIVDIEFIVQYLVLRYAHDFPELLDWTDNVRLLRTLADTGVLSESDAYALRTAYLIYRVTGHKLSLRERKHEVPEERFVLVRERVRSIWRKFLDG